MDPVEASSPFLQTAFTGALAGALGSLVGIFPWLFQRRIEARQRRQEGHWTRWDERRAAALQTCNASLAELHMACSVAFGQPDSPTALADGQAASRRFGVVLHQTAIFFDDDLVAGIKEVQEQAWNVLNRLRMRQEQDPGSTGRDRRNDYEEAYHALKGIYGGLTGELRTRFQALLKTES